MEGTLWKWTNYFSGWQPRWFVLENGILSYYRSQEDVINGCKGSVKMSVCDVTVHPSDGSRLDLIIPGEAHFYVKAATPQERQQWLVALGTSKACLTNGQPATAAAQTAAHAEEIPEEQLKAKKSELRLYCDLLMQQVHSVKSAVQSQDGPDIGQLNESTSLLSATCDTFIAALEECMHMAQASLDRPTTPVPPSPSRKSPSSRSVPWPQVQRSSSLDSGGGGVSRARAGSSTPPDDAIVTGYIPSSRRSSRGGQPSPQPAVPRAIRTISEGSDGSAPPVTPPPLPAAPPGEPVSEHGDSSERLPTLISSLPHKFSDVRVDSSGDIPTETFLDACRAILPIFERFNPTAFAPVILDFSGNIKKIHEKFSASPAQFATLQTIVLFEIAARQNTHSSSATVALLWLKRALEFLVEFGREFLLGADDLAAASNAAYDRTLKPFHNFVNRGAYALAVKSAPTKAEFLRHLAVDAARAAEPAFEWSLKKDMELYALSLDRLVRDLSAFYRQHGIDSPEMI